MTDVRAAVPVRLAWSAAAFFVVVSAQLWLVARAGTDIPFLDQWDVEGARLYPRFVSGSLRVADVIAAHNEHRIACTRLLDLVLFSANGQWDPAVQLCVGALLKGLLAAVLVGAVARYVSGWQRAVGASAVVLALLPIAGWHNALWGFQSQVYFVVLFSFCALRGIAVEESPGWRFAGCVAALLAFLSMGAGILAPVAILGLALLRFLEAGAGRKAEPFMLAAGLFFLGVGVALQWPPTGQVRPPQDWGAFVSAFLRLMAWPHGEQPFAALVLNAPLCVAMVTRVRRWRRPSAGEDLAIATALWGVGVAFALAWGRGAGDELATGVPSRYVDLLLLLPLANGFLLAALVATAAVPQARVMRWAGVGWAGFVVVGWLGVSSEMMRRVIIPRMADREAPIRVVAAFQRTGDPGVFTGVPRLLTPHSNPDRVRAVLNDPRMRGALPPSLQPERAMGPLSVEAWRLLHWPAPNTRSNASAEK